MKRVLLLFLLSTNTIFAYDDQDIQDQKDTESVDEIENVSRGKQNNKNDQSDSKISSDDINKINATVTTILTSGLQGIQKPGLSAALIGAVQLTSWFLQKRANRINSLDFQNNVESVPYKKFLYESQEMALKLLHEATNGPIEKQIAARIMLFNLELPPPYDKYFAKGLQQLSPYCFNDNGDFYYRKNLPDLNKLFKKWHKRRPKSWEKIADLSSHKYEQYGLTKEYGPIFHNEKSPVNETILEMITAGLQEDFLQMHSLLIKYNNETLHTLYERFRDNYLEKNCNEYGILQDAQYDPIWKNLSHQHKLQNLNNADLNDQLILRQVYQNYLFKWVMPDSENSNEHHDICYQSLEKHNTIRELLENKNFSLQLLKNFIDQSCIGVYNTPIKELKEMFTPGGILKKYEHHPLITRCNFNSMPLFSPTPQRYINFGLAVSEKYEDHQTQELALQMIKLTYEAHIASCTENKNIFMEQAKEIYDMLTSPTYQPQNIIRELSTEEIIPLYQEAQYKTPELKEAIKQTIQNNYQQKLYTLSITRDLHKLMLTYALSPQSYAFNFGTAVQEELTKNLLILLEQMTTISKHPSMADQQSTIENILQAIDTAHSYLAAEHIETAMKWIEYCEKIVAKIKQFNQAFDAKEAKNFNEYAKKNKLSSDEGETLYWLLQNMSPAQDLQSSHINVQNLHETLLNPSIKNINKYETIISCSPTTQKKYLKIKSFTTLHKIVKTASLKLTLNVHSRSWYRKMSYLNEDPKISTTSIEGSGLQKAIDMTQESYENQDHSI